MPAGQANARAEDAVAIVQGCVLMYRIHRQLDPLRRQHARLVEECRAGATQAH
jgi:hypothetical protein